ncbi:hypothetical protein HDV06_006946 [Boothiomyces sp. JEL0866]|nr:hypothetical protein HDV06_006946 [Boothiomyces sp. JEL0866]
MASLDMLSVQFESINNLHISPQSKIWLSVISMSTTLGIIGSVLVILSLLKYSITPSNILLLALSIADLIYTVNTFIFSINNLYHGYFSFGVPGCISNYILGMFSSVSSGTIFVLIMFERYLLVFYNYNLTARMSLIWVAVTYATSLLITLIPAFAGLINEAVILGPAHSYCTLFFTNNNQSIITLVNIMMSILGLAMAALIVGYYRIVVFVIKQKKAKSREWQVIKKALIICITYLLCWTPISLSISYQQMTHQPVSMEIDDLCSFTSALNFILNPFLLIALDERIKQNLFGLFKIRVSLTNLGIHSAYSSQS